MHLAELIDQDGHSEDDRVKRRRPVGPEKIPIFAQNFGDGREVLGRLVHDFVGRITRDALLVGAVFHVVPQPLKAGAYSAEGMLEEPVRTFLIIKLTTVGRYAPRPARRS